MSLEPTAPFTAGTIDEKDNPCVDCGAEVDERAYVLTEGAVLCFACAVGRGGAFDDRDERWTIAPFADDLEPVDPRE